MFPSQKEDPHIHIFRGPYEIISVQNLPINILEDFSNRVSTHFVGCPKSVNPGIIFK